MAAEPWAVGAERVAGSVLRLARPREGGGGGPATGLNPVPPDRGGGAEPGGPIRDGRRETASRLRRSEATEASQGRGWGSLRRGEGDPEGGAAQESLGRSGRRASGETVGRRPVPRAGSCQGSRQSSSASSSSSQSNRSSTQRPSRAGLRPPAPRPRWPSPAPSGPGVREPGLAPATPSTNSRPRLTQRSRRCSSGSGPSRPGRRPSRGAAAARFREEGIPGGSRNDPERRFNRRAPSSDACSGRPSGNPSQRFQASSIGPGYRRRPASQRSRPSPTRAIVTPPHSRVQRKVAMAGTQWADHKGPAFPTAPGSQAIAGQATPDSNTSRQLASQRPSWKRSQQVRQARPFRRRR